MLSALKPVKLRERSILDDPHGWKMWSGVRTGEIEMDAGKATINV